MSTPAESTDHTPAAAGVVRHESDTSLLGRLPITLTMKEGTLKLDDGRLSFATRRATVFDHPVHECHSLAPSASVGFHIWHADRCYKFVPAYSPVHEVTTGNNAVDLAVNAGQFGKRLQADRRMKNARDQWFDVLEPLVGRPPAGVKVRRPWSTWKVWLAIVAVALVIMAIIAAIVVIAA